MGDTSQDGQSFTRWARKLSDSGIHSAPLDMADRVNQNLCKISREETKEEKAILSIIEQMIQWRDDHAAMMRDIFDYTGWNTSRNSYAEVAQALTIPGDIYLLNHEEWEKLKSSIQKFEGRIQSLNNAISSDNKGGDYNIFGGMVIASYGSLDTKRKERWKEAVKKFNTIDCEAAIGHIDAIIYAKNHAEDRREQARFSTPLTAAENKALEEKRSRLFAAMIGAGEDRDHNREILEAFSERFKKWHSQHSEMLRRCVVALAKVKDDRCKDVAREIQARLGTIERSGFWDVKSACELQLECITQAGKAIAELYPHLTTGERKLSDHNKNLSDQIGKAAIEFLVDVISLPNDKGLPDNGTAVLAAFQDIIEIKEKRRSDTVLLR